MMEGKVQWREKHNGGRSKMEAEPMEGEVQWREKRNEGSKHDKWRNPMEDGSAMEGECNQREKCVEGGSAMEGEREGHQG